MTGTINGREAVVEYVTYGDFAGISYTFEALKHQHNMIRVDKVSPTCTKAGKNTYYHCDACDKYYEDAAATKQITNLASWGNVAALGHTPSELRSNSTHHFKVCTRCYAEIKGSKAAHSGGTATCLDKAKCADCGVSYGNLADHNLATEVWGYIDGAGHAHLCLTQDCYHRGELLPHRSSGAATATTDEVCLDCGFVITLAENHAHTALEGYQHDAESHWKICGCGYVMDKKPHADGNSDKKCDICSYELATDIPDNTEKPGIDPTTPPQNDGGNNNNGAILWITILIALLLGIAAGVIFVIAQKKKRKEAEEK